MKDFAMDQMIRTALEEDIGNGDITTLSTVDEDKTIEGSFIAKEKGGTSWASRRRASAISGTVKWLWSCQWARMRFRPQKRFTAVGRLAARTSKAPSRATVKASLDDVRCFRASRAMP